MMDSELAAAVRDVLADAAEVFITADATPFIVAGMGPKRAPEQEIHLYRISAEEDGDQDLNLLADALRDYPRESVAKDVVAATLNVQQFIDLLADAFEVIRCYDKHEPQPDADWPVAVQRRLVGAGLILQGLLELADRTN